MSELEGMDRDVAREWVEALESGKYAQTTGALANRWEERGNWEFCCLGVLCEIAHAKGVVSRQRHKIEPGFEQYGYDEDKDCTVLPVPVAYWAKLEHQDPEIEMEDRLDPDSYCERSLSDLNDSGMSFAEIAAVIRKEANL